MKWISVKDELPKKSGSYLIYTQDYRHRNEPVRTAYWADYFMPETTNPTHWMPLPEPPVEEFEQPTEITSKDIQDSVDYLKSPECRDDWQRHCERELAEIMRSKDKNSYKVIKPKPCFVKYCDDYNENK